MLIFDQSGTGLPILCLHGHPGSRQCMGVFTQKLSGRWRTIAPDLRGYGASKAQASFQMSIHLNDILTLLDYLALPQVVVLGWSLGGIVGTELALEHPDRVAGLILVASAAHPWGNHPPVSVGEYVNTIIASVINRFNADLAWNRDRFGRNSLYRYLVQTHTAQTYQFLAQEAWPAFWKTSRYAHQALNQALKRGYNRLDDVHQVRCPALVLAGECDRHITPEASYQTYQRLADSEWICYPKTAHLFPWEIPHQVMRDIEGWLECKFPLTQ